MKTKKKTNNHKKSLDLLRNSDFSVKKLVTFNGHEGQGANADIYWKKSKMATFIDEGNGGEPYVYFVFDEIKNATDKWKSCKDFIASLPAYSQAEEYEDSDFDWDETRKPWKASDVVNALVLIAEERREFKKILRKICGIKELEGKKCLVTWNRYKKADLSKLFIHESKPTKLRDILKAQGAVVLNVLPENEAFDLLRQYA